MTPVQVVTRPTTFTPIRPAAARLGVPLAWLRGEIEAGRVPALIAGRSGRGRRILVDFEVVQKKLRERAAPAEAVAR